MGWRAARCGSREGLAGVAAHPYASRSGRSLAADAGRRRQRAGAGTAAARAVAQGGREGTPAGALTCKNIRREAKRRLFGQGGKVRESQEERDCEGCARRRALRVGGDHSPMIQKTSIDRVWE